MSSRCTFASIATWHELIAHPLSLSSWTLCCSKGEGVECQLGTKRPQDKEGNECMNTDRAIQPRQLGSGGAPLATDTVVIAMADLAKTNLFR